MRQYMMDKRLSILKASHARSILWGLLGNEGGARTRNVRDWLSICDTAMLRSHVGNSSIANSFQSNLQSLKLLYMAWLNSLHRIATSMCCASLTTLLPTALWCPNVPESLAFHHIDTVSVVRRQCGVSNSSKGCREI